MARKGYTRWGPHKTVTNVYDGHSYGNRFHDEYPRSINTGFESISDAIPSDRKSPTPFFREQVRMAGEEPLVATWRDLHPSDGERQRTSRTEYLSDRLPDIAFMPQTDAFLDKLGNASDRSRTEARNKAGRTKDQVQLGTNLMEARKTADMMASYVTPLWKSLLAVKRGQWRELPQTWGWGKRSGRDLVYGRTAANKWLEYQYGWKPTMSDAYNAYNKLSTIVEQPLTWNATVWSPVDFEHVNPNFNGCELHQSESGGVRVSYQVAMRNSFAHDMHQWGLNNPLAVAWELIPFSFFIDWGIPIGNVLNSLTATAGLDMVWGFESTLQRSTWRVTNSYAPSWGDWQIESPGNLSFSRTRFDRRLLPGFAPPGIYGEDNPFSWGRIKNAAALARQLFTGRM